MRVVVLCAVALLSLAACGTEDDDFVDTAEVEASEEEQALLLSGGYGRPTGDDTECKDTNAGTLRCDEDSDVVTSIRR